MLFFANKKRRHSRRKCLREKRHWRAVSNLQFQLPQKGKGHYRDKESRVKTLSKHLLTRLLLLREAPNCQAGLGCAFTEIGCRIWLLPTMIGPFVVSVVPNCFFFLYPCLFLLLISLRRIGRLATSSSYLWKRLARSPSDSPCYLCRCRIERRLFVRFRLALEL
jgi:hypothetical protein